MGLTDFISDVFGGGSSGAANIPARSPEETRLAGLQADSLSRSMKLQELLMPFQLSQLGLTPSFDPSGNLTGVTQDPTQKALQDSYTQFAQQQLKYQQENAPAMADIQKSFNDRTLAALQGKLPIDPALTQQLNDSQRNLTNSLRTQLGTGASTSSPGIETQGRFDLNRTIAEEAARRGDISTATQLGLGVSGFNTNAGMTSADLSAKLKGMSLNEMLGLPTMSGYTSSLVNTPLQLSNTMRLGTGQLAQKSQEFNTEQGMDIFGDFLGAGTRIFGGSKPVET